jgi:nicotinamide phosphoribosyltransferase
MNDLMRQRATFDEYNNIVGYSKLEDNPILDTDSYKPSHAYQYSEDMQSMYSYFASRGGRYRYTCFNGMQPLMLRYLATQVTLDHVREAGELFASHGEPFNREGWERIVTYYKGRLPLRIRAVPEGSIVATGNVLFDIELTTSDPVVAWLPGWFETKLVRVWYPTTVATRGFYLKGKILEALEKSSNDPMGEIDFKLHCFGGRGASTLESAGIGGCAHLINFKGTDTVEALRYAKHYYGESMAGFSIPAAEHSTVCSWVPKGVSANPGPEFEESFYTHFVEQFLLGKCGKKYPMAACVSDAYDFYNAVENMWCGEHLHNMVRSSGGTLVVRPDSGRPAEVDVRALEIFDRKIGMEKNLKGFKVLPAYYRLIQGDGVNDESIPEILHEVLSHDYSASNLAFGMGGGGLQDMTRDTQKMAQKMSAVLFAGKWSPVFKKPKTDPGKDSLRGRLALVKEGRQYVTHEQPRKDDCLVPIFESGRVLKTYTFDEVRANALKAFL